MEKKIDFSKKSYEVIMPAEAISLVVNLVFLACIFSYSFGKNSKS